MLTFGQFARIPQPVTLSAAKSPRAKRNRSQIDARPPDQASDFVGPASLGGSFADAQDDEVRLVATTNQTVRERGAREKEGRSVYPHHRPLWWLGGSR